MGTLCIRFAIFASVCVVVGGVWCGEHYVDIHGIPFGLLGLISIFPWFLAWFFGKEIWARSITRTTFLAPVGLASALGLALLFDLAATRVRKASSRMQIANNLKQISLAMHNYQTSFGTFPPAILRDKDGKPIHSWRVLLLPYLEASDLYSKFHLDEPWDSPHNIALADQMPRVYAGPEEIAVSGGKTFYQVLVGPGTAFEGGQGFKSPQDFPDGIESTILVVEARNPVLWTQPVDLPFIPDGALPPFGAPRGSSIPSVFCAAMVDGSVRMFATAVSPEPLRSWITRNGGDKAADVAN
jgi:hypothetical protein